MQFNSTELYQHGIWNINTLLKLKLELLQLQIHTNCKVLGCYSLLLISLPEPQQARPQNQARHQTPRSPTLCKTGPTLHTHPGFLLEKNLRGAKDNRPLFFKTIGYCFHCSFYCFFKILGCRRLLGGKSFWGVPPAPVAESQHPGNKALPKSDRQSNEELQDSTNQEQPANQSICRQIVHTLHHVGMILRRPSIPGPQ